MVVREGGSRRAYSEIEDRSLMPPPTPTTPARALAVITSLMTATPKWMQTRDTAHLSAHEIVTETNVAVIAEQNSDIIRMLQVISGQFAAPSGTTAATLLSSRKQGSEEVTELMLSGKSTALRRLMGEYIAAGKEALKTKSASALVTSKTWRELVVAKLTEEGDDDSESNSQLIQDLSSMTEDALITTFVTPCEEHGSKGGKRAKTSKATSDILKNMVVMSVLNEQTSAFEGSDVNQILRRSLVRSHKPDY